MKEFIKKRRIGIALIGAVVLVTCAWRVLFPKPPEPEHQGKRLSWWLTQNVPQTNQFPWIILRKEAQIAVREMGVEVVPALLRKMEMPKNELARKLEYWAGAIGLPLKVPILFPGEFAPQLAVVGFQSISSEAKKVAVPHLVEMLGSLQTQEWAFRALCNLGSDGTRAICEALPTISDREARVNAIVKIEFLRSLLGPGVVDFIPALAKASREDPDAFARLQAARLLGILGLRPELAVPALIEVLKDRDSLARGAAAEALGRFGAQAAAALPELRYASTNDSNPQVRTQAAAATQLIE